MLYLASALSLLVSISFGAYPANYPEHPTDLSYHLGVSDPNYDQCQTAGMDDNQPLEITVTVNNWYDFLTGCICGGMKDGDVFTTEWEHVGGYSDLSELNEEATFTGEGLAGRLILTPKHKVGDIWAKIQPTGYDISETIVVTLIRSRPGDQYSDGEVEERDTFTIIFLRPEAEPAVEGVFVIRTSEPKGRRDCLKDSSDVANAIAYGDDIYVCVIFCNAICPSDYGTTTFGIHVSGQDSYGDDIPLISTSVLPSPELTCDDYENKFETYRYVQVSLEDAYSDLSRLNVSAVITSYGVAQEFEDYRKF